MTTYLLDANALIALTVREHVHHARVSGWLGRSTTFALCPITEGALVRFLVRLGERAAVAKEVIARLQSSPRTELWSDSVSYVDVAMDHVTGHRQVTDAYLLALADAHPTSRLATLDTGLAALAPKRVLLIPEQ